MIWHSWHSTHFLVPIQVTQIKFVFTSTYKIERYAICSNGMDKVNVQDLFAGGAIAFSYSKIDFRHRFQNIFQIKLQDQNFLTEEVVSSDSLYILKNKLDYLMTAREICLYSCCKYALCQCLCIPKILCIVRLLASFYLKRKI